MAFGLALSGVGDQDIPSIVAKTEPLAAFSFAQRAHPLLWAPMSTQLEDLRKMLVGSVYSRFTVGDNFDFHFDEFVLSARDLVADGEVVIGRVLFDAYAPIGKTATSEYVAKSVIAAASLGISIIRVDLLFDSSLVLTFGNEVTIHLPTNTPVVDWHWAITKGGGDPYLGCVIACFAPGDVQGRASDESAKPLSERR